MSETPIDDGSDKPLGHQTEDGELEVRENSDGSGPCYHETPLGQHQRWMRQAPDLYGLYHKALGELAAQRCGKCGHQFQKRISTIDVVRLSIFIEYVCHGCGNIIITEQS